MDLYHRTSSEAAAEIARTGRFISLCQDREHAFFTDNPVGERSRQYGQTVMHVLVPAWAALPDEVFDDESYFRVRLEHLADCSVTVAPRP
ncbi:MULTISPECIES: hypothetical protein [Brachybacterium]|uniref:Uncharacterized protein n=1 Tax=Brachybacterium kimchii TaxID=2942909 RepID=A0ABY4N7L8_9MICO|nr:MULTISPECIES: hypothetical protein [Brachybacterium]MCG7309708.1 hypothetical protein [Brachybacterium sp. ACRRE]UQN30555.1 hypothetical protein M4486_04380 [Brachybacterium kimchii]